MTPKEIVEEVRGRFPLLMYEGYPPNVEPQFDGDGDKVFFPRELKRALDVYSRRVAVKRTLVLSAGDLDDNSIDYPFDYLSVDSCKDKVAVFVQYYEDSENRRLSFAPVMKWADFRWPLQISYYVDLKAYVPDNRELPTACDDGLIGDWLEAAVGKTNAQHIKVMDAFDLNMELKSFTEYAQDLKDCEERMKELQSLPLSPLATAF